MEKVVIIETNDVVDTTWYYGAYGALFFAHPSVGKASTFVGEEIIG
jgi:hypothetical protein